MEWQEWLRTDETKQFTNELRASRQEMLESILVCKKDDIERRIGMVLGVGIVIDEINKRREVSNGLG